MSNPRENIIELLKVEFQRIWCQLINNIELELNEK
jgi:hypothetical protein